MAFSSLDRSRVACYWPSLGFVARSAGGCSGRRKGNYGFVYSGSGGLTGVAGDVATLRLLRGLRVRRSQLATVLRETRDASEPNVMTPPVQFIRWASPAGARGARTVAGGGARAGAGRPGPVGFAERSRRSYR